MKPPKKKPLKQLVKAQRNAAKIDLLKHLFSEIYTPNQVASIKFEARKDYGMDSEVINFVTRVSEKFRKLDRGMFPFEVFKLILLYICTPDIRRIVGDVQIPEFDYHHHLTLSKIEKIRLEFYVYKFRARPITEPHICKILDYIIHKIEPTYKYVEIIEYAIDKCELSDVIDRLCDQAPKRDYDSGNPGQQRHDVFVAKLRWPERGYVISKDIYEMFPELQDFFESKDGIEFYEHYMKYIASLWPKMDDSILDHVNSFTNAYFKWMVELLRFPANLPPEIRWKYSPMETPFTKGKSPDSKKKFLLRVFEYYSNGKLKKRYVFVHDIRVIMLKLKTLGVKFYPTGELMMPEEGTPPLVHEIFEVTGLQAVMLIIQKLSPFVYDYLELLKTQFHSLAAIENKFLPIVSPYNAHCIPAVQGMERIAEVLVDEVQIGRRLPLNFRALEVLIKRMDGLFTGSELKTMVDRQTVHDLMNEATSLIDKYNGKLTIASPNFAYITETTPWEDRLDAFLNEYPQFIEMYTLWRSNEFPIPQDYKCLTPPGQPSVDEILPYIWKKCDKSS